MIKVGLLVCLLGLGIVANANAASAGAIVVKPVKMGPHSYYVKGLSGAASPENQGYMSNAGFVVTKAGVVVFDTLGTPELAQSLVKAIAKITSQPIRRVIISHYHADHIYGMQVFKALGAEIWAHRAGQEYVGSEEASMRLAQRLEALKPWMDENTQVLPADKWLEGDASFEMGGVHFELRHVGPAHSSEDMAMFVKEDGMLYSGDLVFKGRVPFVGTADSRMWLKALDKLIVFNPKFMIPGHGAASSTPVADLKLTRDYLIFVRQAMGKAVQDFVPFDEAYTQTDWSQFSKLPAFLDANRANAYNTYLLMERESLNKQ
ncbi:MAG: MBL fold metallo-hydrolase [Gallionellales bacterium 35-53-114]|jgi:glyoxylase-like metal-dependent hydrolase (beta-lactamase superfamily II)|nr:MAG: MBL fold metallo-hydrolase [Gallionellales bacterium 35-53-114]OYZ62704.1 MAG: MBL fold metallo-hydrolase [Gallionellales bacterium 24-53-125]OZB09780.1 MAG: MBL fold metallo-hydrolase [Gallionellales bacterium 39-52-133]HQS57657.1 MBL fold metallo-hydrolase [Gallionellaceae bacterium]HQS74111.1 MBL fold metallo-hydrolase [Gallionellaceae bacterium]